MQRCGLFIITGISHATSLVGEGLEQNISAAVVKMRSATLAVKPTRTPCRCWSVCLLQQLRDCRNRKECNDSLSTSNSSKEYMLLYHGIAERWKSVHLAQAGTNQKISQTLLLRLQFQLSYISTVSLIFSAASFHLYISQGAVTKPLRIRVKHSFFLNWQ